MDMFDSKDVMNCERMGLLEVELHVSSKTV